MPIPIATPIPISTPPPRLAGQAKATPLRRDRLILKSYDPDKISAEGDFLFGGIPCMLSPFAHDGNPEEAWKYLRRRFWELFRG